MATRPSFNQQLPPNILTRVRAEVQKKHHHQTKADAEAYTSTVSSPPQLLLLLSLLQQQPLVHQTCLTSWAKSQSGHVKWAQISTREDNCIDINMQTLLIRYINISLTLAFWMGRPLDSSFMSTVDVVISEERVILVKNRFLITNNQRSTSLTWKKRK